MTDAESVGCLASPSHARSAGAGDAGLVPSKTSRHDLLLLSPSAVADRRVRRLKRAVWASAHLHGIVDHGKPASVCWFVTLTYRRVDDWRADHVSKAVERFRGWCRSAGAPCRYTWVAELQARGAVHYHLLAWLPVGLRMPHWDRVRGRRSAFWSHGMSNTEQARAGVGYLMKYLSKFGDQTRFPKGLRLYGIGGLDNDGRAVRAWLNLPVWARRAFGVGDLWRSARGLVVCATGEVHPPVWKLRRVPGALELCKLLDVPPRFGVDVGLGLTCCPGAFSTWPRVVP